MALRFVLAAAWIVSCTPAGAATRLAVIAPPDCAKEASLLTAALSSHEGVELLERDEINKVAAERNLQAITAENGLKLGGLLKADGLVLLELGSQELTMRVLDVDSGALVKFSSSPSPLSDPASWSKLRAGEIAKVAAKLAEPMSKLTPISLLRINSAQGGAQGRSLEESLNRILAERLSTSPELVILERSKLQEALGEKGLAPENGPFWNSAWVLDGSVTPSGKGYSLRLRFQPPGNETARTVDVEAADVAALVEMSYGKILSILQQPVKPWDSSAEASRFFEESQWASKNGLWDQAVGASEAAVALGKNQKGDLEWRWRSYLALAGNDVRGSYKPDVANEPPSVRQLLTMARCLLLCRESLADSVSPLESRNSERSRFSAGSLVNPYGTGPAAEASKLLESSTFFLKSCLEKRKQLDEPRQEALVELRSQTRQLFDEVIRISPSWQLRSRPDGLVPRWDPKGDPKYRKWLDSSQSFPRDKGDLKNAHFIRLSSGRLWEESPEGYFAYLRKCLAGDIEADPYFFGVVMDTIAWNAHWASFRRSDPAGPEWREAGEEMAKDSNESVQIGAATILLRVGLPLQGLEIFEKREHSVLKGDFPIEYLLSGFDVSSFVPETMRRAGGGTLEDARAAIVKFLVEMLNRGLIPSDRLFMDLTVSQLSDRQAAAILSALRNPASNPPGAEGSPRWDNAHWAIRYLSERAGEIVKPVQANPPPPAQPVPGPDSLSDFPTLNVDLGWVAKNAGDPLAPGVIRWAYPQGNEVWVQVEFPKSRATGRVRREFVAVELGSMKSRVVHRDLAPEIDGLSRRREGPVFATDGAGVYFWDGKSIGYACDGKMRTISVPDLVEPFFWMVDGILYAADREGLFLQYDPASGNHQILASSRRRPALSPLDAEPGLKDLQNVCKNPDGLLAVTLRNTQVYRTAFGEWQKPKQAFGKASSVEALLEPPSDASGHPKKAFTLNDALVRYLRPVPLRMGEKGFSLCSVKSQAVGNGDLWFLVSDLSKVKLLRVRLADKAFTCRPLSFSPELLTAYSQTGGGDSLPSLKLIPVPAGIALFEPGRAVLWFIPASDLTLPAPP